MAHRLTLVRRNVVLRPILAAAPGVSYEHSTVLQHLTVTGDLTKLDIKKIAAEMRRTGYVFDFISSWRPLEEAEDQVLDIISV